jgi:conjugal transfer pilus assembly protein TraK
MFNTKISLTSVLFAALSWVMFCTTASADQQLIAADNSRVDCQVARRELTRINLIGDQFAAVSKVSTGVPYNDFNVINEPVRGDLYISVPETYAPKSISFFATSKKGYVYKFACKIVDGEAVQIFISNPAIAESTARSWEEKAGATINESAARLIQSMYASELPDGFRVSQPWSNWQTTGDVRLRMMAAYEGATMKGLVFRVENRGKTAVTLNNQNFEAPGTVAVSLVDELLQPGQATSAYIVKMRGN